MTHACKGHVCEYEHMTFIDGVVNKNEENTQIYDQNKAIKEGDTSQGIHSLNTLIMLW